MKSRMGLWSLLALLFLSAQAQAACDYEISDVANTLSATRTAVDEELECIEDIIDAGGGGGSLSDGDKGDITVASSGTVWTIDANAVNAAKIATGSVGSDELDEAGVESGLEAVLDLNDLQDAGSGSFWTTGLYGVTSTSDSAADGPGIRTFRDSPGPAANDFIGFFDMWGENSADSGDTLYGGMGMQIIDPTFGSIDGRLVFYTSIANSVLNKIYIGDGIYSRNVTGGDQGIDTANFSNYLDDGANINTIYGRLATTNAWTDVNTFSTTGAVANVIITSTDAGTTAAPLVDLYRDSPSPAASDNIARVRFLGEDSSGAQAAYTLLTANIIDPTDSSEDGRFVFSTTVAGTLTTRAFIGNGIYTASVLDMGLDTVNASTYYINGVDLTTSFLATTTIDTSAELRTILTDETGTGAAMFGITSSMADDLACAASTFLRRNAGDTAWECVAGTGAGVQTTDIDTSAELRGILTDEVGTGAAMFGLISTMTDDLACTASQVVRRNSGDTAFECATIGALTDGDKGDVVVATSGTVWTLDLTVSHAWTAAQSISTTGTGTIFTLTSTDAGATSATLFELYRDSATPLAADGLAGFSFAGEDSGGAKLSYGSVAGEIVDPTDTTEDGRIAFATPIAGTNSRRWFIGNGLYYFGGTDPGASIVNATDYYISGTSIFATTNIFTAAQAVTTTGTAAVITARSTDAGAAAAQLMKLDRDSASPLAADILSSYDFYGNDTAAADVYYAGILGAIDDPTDGSEDGQLRFATILAGTFASRFRISSGLFYNGGIDQGAGTGNFTDLYIDGTLYTGAATLTFLDNTDPGADRGTFWDDSASQYDWLTYAAPLAITGQTLDITTATTSADGTCELATTTEANAQSSTSLCVTPQGLAFKPENICVALGDETTAITTGTAKTTIRNPYNTVFTVTGVKASLTTASSSGLPTFDINEGGTSIISTKISIDASERTSTTAATAAVISDSSIASDAEITFDIDVAGTNAAGAKVCIVGHQL